MISIDDLREGLNNDATERGLSDLMDDCDYYPIHGMTPDLAYLGVYVVPIKEGVTIVPFTESLIDYGYEQFDPDAMYLLTDPDEAKYLMDRALRNAEHLQEVALAYLMPETMIQEKAVIINED